MKQNKYYHKYNSLPAFWCLGEPIIMYRSTTTAGAVLLVFVVFLLLVIVVVVVLKLLLCTIFSVLDKNHHYANISTFLASNQPSQN